MLRRGLGMHQQGKIEISFAGVVLLGGATVLASALVFLLGVYVGKGMIESRLADDTRVVRLPAPTPGATPKAGDEVTFWDRLGDNKQVWTPAPAPTATPIETPVRVSPSAASRSAEPTPPAAKPEARVAPTARPEPVKPEPVKPEPIVTGGFQVQVNAMADRRRADALVQDLVSLGYKAYLSPAKRGKDTLYRVRVAGLNNEDAAKQAVARLREQGYPKAFLVREGG